ncbi:MAG: NAD(P)-dependent oxidoreductase [Bacteroidetes bacterium]|nr:NAD(P)-dependent oxidoreductase [Bacteroidota bacterium]MBU1718673.1 NAD(P)-dependent oxidoreductase [Bacteroidota bacterium]
MKKLLITGAAGNLGGLLAEYMKDSGLELRLMIHRKDIDPKLKTNPAIETVRADLGNKETLDAAVQHVDTIVHFAGILFKHNPEKFLPKTNTLYFKNLVEAAISGNVKRIILISFPHVEGETTPENPATGKLDGQPSSMHAKTRLEEEKLLFSIDKKHNIEAISLRVGMVYGRGILMIDAARWFAKYKLLGVWKMPTWIHLISTPDFLEATKQAIVREKISGIYHLGDEGTQTLQEFLDAATRQWGYKKPWRMPVRLIMCAARMFECWSFVFGVKSPLTRDFVKIGMASYYGDTSRMRAELLQKLKFSTYREGIETL